MKTSWLESGECDRCGKVKSCAELYRRAGKMEICHLMIYLCEDCTKTILEGFAKNRTEATT